jgi:V/A-type H+-transporting ATPase subunit E
MAMTGLEKIVEQILADARLKSEEIKKAAEAEAGQILEDAQKNAGRTKTQSAERINIDKKNKAARAKSSADLKKRQALLSAKQEIITDIIDKAYDKMLNLDTEEYFLCIEKLISRYASDKKGKVFLSEKDLKRAPKGFAEKVAEAGKQAGGSLVLADESRNIDGGFVLGYGGIEENCSFKAIFSSERERLADKVNQFLFA